ncbi:MAG: carbohydrate kinase family protein [Actinomycetota bacterium]
MSTPAIALPAEAPFRRLVGVGGIGTGLFLAVEGDRTIGRTESRAARLLDVHDYCKLHTVTHHVAVLLGARPDGVPFHVVPIGVVGADEAGERMVAEMAAAGMDVARVRTVPDRPTLFSVCFQYPDGEGGNITTGDSAAAALSDDDVDAAAGVLDERTIALAQPEVPLEPRRRFLQAAGERGCFRAASFTSSELDEARGTGLFSLVDLVALNAHEAATIVGAELDPTNAAPFLGSCADAFPAGTGVVITAGADGGYAIERGRWIHRPAPVVDVVSTAGCGDALLAGVLVGLAGGAPLIGETGGPADDALSLGVVLASLNATSPHTIDPGATVTAVRELAARSGIPFGGALTALLQPQEARA